MTYILFSDILYWLVLNVISNRFLLFISCSLMGKEPRLEAVMVVEEEEEEVVVVQVQEVEAQEEEVVEEDRAGSPRQPENFCHVLLN